MPEQLTFDLPTVAALGREDFFVSPANATAVAMLEGWQSWPAGKMVLVGPPASGKTHLAHVWAQMTGAAIIGADALATADIAALAEGPALVVEDLGRPGLDEDALFHLHNLCAAEGSALLMTAAAPPALWPLRLADLASRMQAATVTTLEPPDDALLQAVLLKLFSDRQITVPPNLLPYLTGRMDRSFAAARALVAKIDAAALSQKRAVTRKLAAEVLDK